MCMHLINDSQLIPVLSNCHNMSIFDGMINLAFPIGAMWILGFFLVFDCILNASAELTCFGDRQFYLDWWNSTSMVEFSRKWNRPVHEYLLRHWYIKLIKQFNLTKSSIIYARIMTMLFSFIFHEIVICASIHTFKTPWITFFSLWQFPLLYVMGSPIFKGKNSGNISFWISILLGLPLVSFSYSKSYIEVYK